jgi:glycosyltransferase involved in cell wall biosynthesis
MQVSCIIPTKNRSTMVMQAITSAIEQQGGNPEIVVVDDNSSDATVACVKKMFPKVLVVETSGLGPGLARNAGAEAASGDILMFLDSDDLWFPHHVDSLCKVLDKGFPVAYGVTRTINEVNGGEFSIPDGFGHSEGDCFRHLLRWCFLVPSATAVKRQAYAAVNGFGAEPHCEDWIFFLKLAARFPFGFAAGPPITLRRLHKGSLSSLVDKSKILQLVRTLIRFLENEQRVEFKDLAHFMRLEQFIEQRGNEWLTVQDWYLAMQEEGII